MTFGGLGIEITISSGILAHLPFGSAELLEVRIPGFDGSGKRERRAERRLKRPGNGRLVSLMRFRGKIVMQIECEACSEPSHCPVIMSTTARSACK